MFGAERQTKGESGALAPHASEANVTKMTFDHGFDKHQSQADAIVTWLVGQINALEALKEFALVGFCNAITLIANAADDACFSVLMF